MTLDGLFLQILNMSITGSYVIMAILLVRLVLQKAPKAFSYALWSVAAFRLLCPVSFSSVVSLFHLKPFNMTSAQSVPGPALVYVPSDIGLMETPKIASGIERADRIIINVLPTANATASVNPIQVWTTIAAIVWLVGLLGLFAYGIFSYIKVRRLVSNAVRLEGNVYEADRIPTPFVLGFLKPRIFLPFRMAESERAYILRHERHHIRRGDHLIKPLSFLLLTVHWFNPFVWIAYTLMVRDMEMSCDESVLRQMGLSLKRDYSESLLALATHKRFPVASPLAFGESNARLRVRNVLHFRRPKTWIMVVSLMLCLAVLLACAANPAVAGSGIPGKTETTNQSVQESVPSGPSSSSLTSAANPSDQKQSTEIGIATDLIRSLLDIPNAQIKAAFEGMNPANPAAGDAAMESAISSLSGGRLIDGLFSSAGTSFRNQVIDFHYLAVMKNFTIKPSSVKVMPNATQKSLYAYEAAVNFSDGQETGKPLKLIGRIQFDNSSKVNFISLEGSDYHAVWVRYAPKLAGSTDWMDDLQKEVERQVTFLMDALPMPGATITREKALAAYADLYARFGGRMEAKPLDGTQPTDLFPLVSFTDYYASMAANAAEVDFEQQEVKRLLELAKAGDVQDLRDTIPKNEVFQALHDLANRFGITLDLAAKRGNDPAGVVAINLFYERYASMAASMAKLDAKRMAMQAQVTLPRFTDTEVNQAKSVVNAYYAALSAKKYEAAGRLMTEGFRSNNTDYETVHSGKITVTDLRYNPDDPARISLIVPDEWQHDPGNVIAFRVDLSFTAPGEVTTYAKDWVLILTRTVKDAPWLIANTGFPSESNFASAMYRPVA